MTSSKTSAANSSTASNAKMEIRVTTLEKTIEDLRLEISNLKVSQGSKKRRDSSDTGEKKKRQASEFDIFRKEHFKDASLEGKSFGEKSKIISTMWANRTKVSPAK